jgi:hypothetical protein
MTKPFGQPTRGFTAPNRLRLVDTFVLVSLREHLRSMPGLFVDLGYGALPLTTVESFERFRRLNPAIRALGVEIDPQRVADAEPFARAGLDFRRGGFNLPLEAGEPVSLVRAFNVLRQYEEHEVEAALDTLARSMTPGAWLIEGTSDPPGRHVCFWAWRRSEEKPLPGRAAKAPLLERRWLVFGARLHTGCSRSFPKSSSITQNPAGRSIPSSRSGTAPGWPTPRWLRAGSGLPRPGNSPPSRRAWMRARC